MSARTASSIRKSLISTGLFAVAISVALIGTGVSYAAWNVKAPVNASTISSGTAALTVSGPSGIDLTLLSPGQSAVAPFTLTNTGTTRLNASVTSTTVERNALSDSLTIRITASATCSAGLTGGISAALVGFTTPSSAPILVPAGASLQLCLEYTLSASAPAAAQNLAVNPVSTITATQVR